MGLENLEILCRRTTEAPGGILAQETREKVFGVWTEEVGQLEFLLENILLNLGVVVSGERRASGKKVKANGTK
jgi:hypothetical protein